MREATRARQGLQSTTILVRVMGRENHEWRGILATMMNKSLEIIEAKWLFGRLPFKNDSDRGRRPPPIDPIHSLVEFHDGSQ